MNSLAKIVRKELLSFWDEQLQVTIGDNAIHIAYPMLLPDGWQVSFSLYCDSNSKTYELSDNRCTFNYLDKYFTVQPKINRKIIEEKCKFFETEIENNDIIRRISIQQFTPLQIQLFAENILALHYLIYRLEKHDTANNQPFETVRNIFISKQVSAESDVILKGKHHPRIHVDFKSGKSIFKIVNNKEPFSAVELTGFRFNDYKLANKNANRVLIYNPDCGKWDSDCQAIADSKDYFEFAAPFYEINKINNFIDEFCEKMVVQ